MPELSERYANAPNKWNISLMITVGGILWAATAFYIGAQFTNHSVSEMAHPAMASQVKDIRSDQVKGQIMDMDKLICEAPNNNFYREELIRLITLWEDINSPKKFPAQLLRCSK